MMINNSSITVPVGINSRPLQDALDALHCNQIDLAHRYLLKALQADPQNIQIWWLLGWTAPTSASALYYFDSILENHPDNILAREILQWRSHRSKKEANQAPSNIGETKQLIIKAITYLEKSGGESQPAGRKTNMRNSQMAEREEKVIEILVDRLKEDRDRSHKNIGIALAYLAALLAAESITTLSIPAVGLLLHGAVLVVLILHAALFAERAQQRFLMTLTLAPLIRLMSLSVPLVNFPIVYWYAVIGAPLIAAAFIVLRMTGFDAARIGFKIRALPWQLVVGLTGFGLGYLEYVILRPAPLIKVLTLKEIWLPALILLLFTGFLEEIIFRGLIQRGAAGTLGRYSVIYVSALFAVLHLGYRSIMDLVFVFIVGLLFSAVVARTGSLLGVTLSHGLTNITLYLVLPFLLNPSINPIATAPQLVTHVDEPVVVWSLPNLYPDSVHLAEIGGDGVDINTRNGSLPNIKDTVINWVYLENKNPSKKDVTLVDEVMLFRESEDYRAPVCQKCFSLYRQ